MTGLDFLGESFDSSCPASGIMVTTSTNVPVILALYTHQSATTTDEAKLVLEAKTPLYHQRHGYLGEESMSRLTPCAIFEQANGQHERGGRNRAS